MPTISIIAALTQDRAIGRHGDLIHHISADLRRFKTLTMGHPIIMGRKTFESLPKGALPGRRNMVVSRRGNACNAPGAEVFTSLEEAITALAPDDEAFIIGGGQIYASAIGMADRLLLTEIDEAPPADADTFFPEYDADKWRTDDLGEWTTDPGNGLRYRFICLSRI